MAMKKSSAVKKPSRLTKALLETADDMRKGGLLDVAAHEKITMRLVGSQEAPSAVPVTSDDIRKMREKANMSQAVFAHFLNVTVGYVSQLERGTRRPSGPALALLNVIRRKGMEALL
jgi:putative transcriptional regulator